MPLSKKERAALAMHEIMLREQRKLSERIQEQREISKLSDNELARLVGKKDVPIEET